jgi:hypothetical protein
VYPKESDRWVGVTARSAVSVPSTVAGADADPARHWLPADAATVYEPYGTPVNRYSPSVAVVVDDPLGFRVTVAPASGAPADVTWPVNVPVGGGGGASGGRKVTPVALRRAGWW